MIKDRVSEGEPNPDSHWHLDRRVPIALIATLIGYGIATVWWSATIDNRMSVVEKWIDDNRQIQSRLERLEVQGQYIQSSLNEIKHMLGQRTGANP